LCTQKKFLVLGEEKILCSFGLVVLVGGASAEQLRVKTLQMKKGKNPSG
jgi:hypothetical protein